MPELARAAAARMEEHLPWYRALSAEDRSWVGLVAQAGIGAFVAWFQSPDREPQVTADVFGTAPREPDPLGDAAAHPRPGAHGRRGGRGAGRAGVAAR
ncbi:hypothetical protein GCM10025868_45850 [Angustibacter aerolatus]|uniref:PucR C-terminal helix-turn-helix domain-containing protein n=2 Tax=Angustibacter aerolatus TaxID=1162965 RepID=A0ABQ6JRM6_9ACTN|nr:hypothetical protein [Angustibacter aerolatus]GMA89335.1 hypothetical protein GCM10025868_45850 [Angustibacter aerolatus]